MLEKHIFGKGLKLRNAPIKSLFEDVMWVFKFMQPDQKLTP